MLKGRATNDKAVPAAVEPSAAGRLKEQLLPFVPAKAGTQSQTLDPRLRGDERSMDEVTRFSLAPVETSRRARRLFA